LSIWDVIDSVRATNADLSSRLDAEITNRCAETASLDADVTALRTTITRLDADVTTLRTANAELSTRIEGYAGNLLIVRQSILEEWRAMGNKSHRSKKIDHSRNEIAHGGNILLDIEVIERDKQMTDSTSLWIPAFEDTYGIEYSQAKSLALSAPSDLIGLINIRVHVTVLDAWNPTDDSETSQISKNRQSIQDDVMQIVNQYLSASPNEQPTLFRPGGKLVQRYLKVHRLYRTGRSQV
jgi:hypothetical protein